MRIKISEEFEIPNSLASLILGTNIDSPIYNSDFVLTMDSDGAKRFSMILNCIYGRVTPSTQVENKKPDLAKQEVKLEPLKVLRNEPKTESNLNMASLRNKAKKFIDNGS